MAKIQLSHEDTLNLIYTNNKINAFKNKWTFSTKYPWKCLGCLTELFISFNQFGINSIFCDKCKYIGNNPNIVQYQYLRVLKERQIALIDSFDVKENIKETILSETD